MQGIGPRPYIGEYAYIRPRACTGDIRGVGPRLQALYLRCRYRACSLGQYTWPLEHVALVTRCIASLNGSGRHRPLVVKGFRWDRNLLCNWICAGSPSPVLTIPVVNGSTLGQKGIPGPGYAPRCHSRLAGICRVAVGEPQT